MTTIQSKASNVATVARIDQVAIQVIHAYQGLLSQVAGGAGKWGTAELVITNVQDGVGDDGKPEGKVITFHLAGTVASVRHGAVAEVALERLNRRSDLEGAAGAFINPLEVEGGVRQWDMYIG